MIRCTKIEPRAGAEGPRAGGSVSQVRFRLWADLLPVLIICLASGRALKTAKPPWREWHFRVLFFVMTFFTIGMVSNFRKLWEKASAS